MIVFGIHAVREAVRAGRVSEVRVADRQDARVRQVVEEAAALGVLVRQVPRDAMDRDARGGVHQGVMAMVAALPSATLEDLCAGVDAIPLIVVLDGVEDPQNVGAILRSVDAAGGTGLVRQSRHAARLDGAAAKASAGAVHHVPTVEVVNIARALEALKAGGVWTVGLDGHAKTHYYELDLTVPTALVVGGEGHGLRRLVRERCDFVAAIPMSGHVDSLNVSVAAGIVLYEAVRQRRSRGRR